MSDLYLGDVKLKEYYTLKDYKITEHSRLKLLINMRSGFMAIY